jgi:Zn-finger nucleic acid-binding protein
MSTEKPSRNEDEYFARQDAELLAAQRTAAAATAAEAERRSHFMKCPKCGHDLETMNYEGIAIDRCTNCAGIWLDPGELEQLRDLKDGNMLSRMFDDASAFLAFKKKKKQQDAE